MGNSGTKLQRLLAMGFREVGKWYLIAGGVAYTLTAEEKSRNILYVFESEGRILYIGKTTQPLKVRMYGYQNPGPTQSTNQENNTNLKKSWQMAMWCQYSLFRIMICFTMAVFTSI